ncbi:unnamed protein product [Aspergillus oryzae RIB40]|uniref:DNA, SC011 n=1 Tax=Aspergillus oryzae (strain ATCC 42149 / RIB 40) TaxID=510516 RepID=Q2U159_ASPOR|nr:unnamed protein product [Aspergillus oryzae RIB40]BAE64706.1 unnamed protein product [Aspergillus oryzae RIB40]
MASRLTCGNISCKPVKSSALLPLLQERHQSISICDDILLSSLNQGVCDYYFGPVFQKVLHGWNIASFKDNLGHPKSALPFYTAVLPNFMKETFNSDVHIRTLVKHPFHHVDLAIAHGLSEESLGDRD